MEMIGSKEEEEPPNANIVNDAVETYRNGISISNARPEIREAAKADERREPGGNPRRRFVIWNTTDAV
jgi:hypothetical protein